MLQALNFGFLYTADYVKVEGISSDIPCCTISFTFRHVGKLRVMILKLVLS
jgi:hypothetical protein